MARSAERWRLVAVITAVAVITVGPQIGGRIEAWMSPVIETISSDMAARGQDLACWRWRFIRHRAAVFIETDTKITIAGDVIDSVALVGDRAPPRYFRASRTASPSPDPQQRVICVDLSRAEIRASDAFAVTVRFRYLTWHGLWTVQHTLPQMAFPARQGL